VYCVINSFTYYQGGGIRWNYEQNSDRHRTLRMGNPAVKPLVPILPFAATIGAARAHYFSRRRGYPQSGDCPAVEDLPTNGAVVAGTVPGFAFAGVGERCAPPGSKNQDCPGKVKAIVQATLHSTPRGATHWSTRTMTRAQGFSEATVRRIWKRYRLQPHRVKTFKLSRDPRFIEKLHDIVGLYLNPPDKALVWCVDEKSQIQALERTEPLLPLRPACWPNRHTITSAMGRPLSSPPSACSMGKSSATPCRVIAILSGSLIFSKMPSCFKISRTLQRP
jgi:hypothetical protein